MTEWPEWGTAEHLAIHTALENEIKQALQHCIDSADAAGMPWTTEGWISVSASKIMVMLRRAGVGPPAVGDVEALPLPREAWDEDEDDVGFRRGRVRQLLGDGWAQMTSDEMIDASLERADEYAEKVEGSWDREQQAAYWIRLWFDRPRGEGG